jgi:hypothetical protein
MERTQLKTPAKSPRRGFFRFIPLAATILLVSSIALSSSLKGLTSEIRNVRHGIKNRKYYANLEVVIRNRSPKPIARKLDWLYSLCFDPPGQCIAGGRGGSLKGLAKGRKITKKIKIKYDGPRFCETKGKTKTCRSFRGYKPYFSVMVNTPDNEDPLYEKKFPMGPVGNYK